MAPVAVVRKWTIASMQTRAPNRSRFASNRLLDKQRVSHSRQSLRRLAFGRLDPQNAASARPVCNLLDRLKVGDRFYALASARLIQHVSKKHQRSFSRTSLGF